LSNSPSASRHPLVRFAAREDVRLVGHLLLALGALFLVIAAVGYLFRPQLAGLGTTFVERFGLLGMALGTFLADAFQFPIAPQFYMLAAIARGDAATLPLLVISAASMVAGSAGYLIAYRSSSVPFLRRKLERSRPLVERLLARYGAWSFVLLSISPVPYSIVCYLIGMYRMPTRYLALFVGLRGPRLAVMYVVIRAAWAASGR
jgi:membrane protein YqaA with SNARE-associated domain